MPDTPPDHLSNNPRSPFFKEDVLKRDIGVRFNGTEKTNVEEYCVSEGWVRVEVGKTKDRYGNPMTIKLSGKVEPYFRDKAPDSGTAEEMPAASEKAAEVAPAAKTEEPPKAEKAAKSKTPEKPGKPEKAEPKKTSNKKK